MEEYIRAMINLYIKEFNLIKRGYDCDDIKHMVPAVVRYFQLRGYDLLYDAYYDKKDDKKGQLAMNVRKTGNSEAIGRLKINPVTIRFIAEYSNINDFFQTFGTEISGIYQEGSTAIYYDKDGVRVNESSPIPFDFNSPVKRVEEIDYYIRDARSRER